MTESGIGEGEANPDDQVVDDEEETNEKDTQAKKSVDQTEIKAEKVSPERENDTTNEEKTNQDDAVEKEEAEEIETKEESESENKVETIEVQDNAVNDETVYEEQVTDKTGESEKATETKETEEVKIADGEQTQEIKTAGEEEKKAEPVQEETKSKEQLMAEELDPKNLINLSSQEKINVASKYKDLGNAAFKAGDYPGAVDMYNKATSAINPYYFQHEADMEIRKEVNKVLRDCLLNAALCMMRLDKHATAAELCTSALKLDANNVKALYRRALAKKAMGQNTEALQDLKLAIEQEPNDKKMREEYAAIRELSREEKQKSQSLFKAMTGNKPEDAKEEEYDDDEEETKGEKKPQYAIAKKKNGPVTW
eukprot:CAMPEP_0115031824 /NCGR_PEP_ID=MMETSP0216-20121206/38786_1 /TAXON_ID=223996 /ORGANISM="Protocruzia adherens, Strain Boccale" /LENGTH=367 /DNA_ID=CAMNT_0002409593 /DNA_START=244 /DNA_END=1344 /DNA_ORIENTATION=-